MITLYHKTMDFTLVFMINFSHNGHLDKNGFSQNTQIIF
jgi:hypothetical protein